MHDKTALRRPPKTICLFVTHSVSAKIFYRSYLRFLVSRGWEVHIAAKDYGDLHEFAESENATAHDIRWERRPAPFKDAAALVSAFRLLRKIQPTVVVSATPKAGLLGTVAARLARVPVRLYQLWGLRLENLRGVARAVMLAFERLAASSATRVVANSRSLANEAEKLHISREITVIGQGSSHGVDLRKFAPDAEDIPDLPSRITEQLTRLPAPVVGYVGRIHRDKGVHVLVEACERYVSAGRALTLLVVGWSEDENLLASLKSSVPGLNIVLAGKVDDTRPYLRAMDLHCLPTTREGFPNVVLEASAFSIPTITTDATGAVDSVVDYETGLITQVDDVQALTAAMRGLIDDPGLRSRLGQNARKRVEKHFTQSSIFEQQESLLMTEVGMIKNKVT